jgi:hypothetical protein
MRQGIVEGGEEELKAMSARGIANLETPVSGAPLIVSQKLTRNVFGMSARGTFVRQLGPVVIA